MPSTICLRVHTGSLASDGDTVRADVLADAHTTNRVLILSDEILEEAAIALDEEPEDFVPGVLRYLHGARRKTSRGAPSGIAEFNELACWMLSSCDGIDIHRVFSSTQPGQRKGNSTPNQISSCGKTAPRGRWSARRPIA